MTAIRVLVVDDDPAVRRLVATTLAVDGATVCTAENGLQALIEIDSRPDDFDSIVCDLEMPVMDGHAFVRALQERGCRVPVLILSANGARRAQRELGAAAALSKPFELDVLADRVVQLSRAA